MYFQHNGSTFGFRASLIAHSVKGYGAAWEALISRIMRMIEQEYKWDAIDPATPRRYGPE